MPNEKKVKVNLTPENQGVIDIAELTMMYHEMANVQQAKDLIVKLTSSYLFPEEQELLSEEELDEIKLLWVFLQDITDVC